MGIIARYDGTISLIASKVDYFLRKRIIDKRKELMYLDGTTPPPNRVGQMNVSK